jgi:class 3 adenylate cyclase/CHASE2 domain-containing sensor protein
VSFFEHAIGAKKQIASLLRDRAFVSTVALVVIAFGAAAASTLAVSYLMVLANADQFIQDWEVAALAPSEPQDSRIDIVAIRESTLRQFPYRSPVDRAFLAMLLSTLASRRPSAIGLDILFDQPTERAKDELLRQTLTLLKVPIIVAYSDKSSIVTPEQLAYLNDFVPPNLRGNVTLPEDQYDTVRYVFPGARDEKGHFVPGFARAIAAAIGKPSPAVAVPIVWHGRPFRDVSPFREFPAQTAGILPASWLAGKIILIGADLSLREDRHRTPFAAVLPGGEGTMPGVVIHAHALAQLLDNRRSPHAGWQTDLLIAFACALAGGLLGVTQFHIALRLVAATLLLLIFWAGGAAFYHAAGIMIGLLTPSLAFGTNFWAMEALSGREARLERQFIQRAFSRYVSPDVVKQLIRDPAKMSLQGERKEMSFLFTDIEDFTTLSEQLESRELASLLNAYFDGVTQVVLRWNGTVDKFIGDAVFAIFNAPLPLPDHAERAVRCALDIDTFAEEFRHQQTGARAGLRPTRIGVHTGEAVVGNFGSSARFAYTAQGDAVNIASRLEALNKHFGTRICVSGNTKSACSGVDFRPVARVIVKGKTRAVEVWEPLHRAKENRAFLEKYDLAYQELATSRPEAQALFEALIAEAPHDPCVRFHLQRLRHGQTGIAIKMDEK